MIYVDTSVVGAGREREGTQMAYGASIISGSRLKGSKEPRPLSQELETCHTEKPDLTDTTVTPERAGLSWGGGGGDVRRPALLVTSRRQGCHSHHTH